VKTEEKPKEEIVEKPVAPVVAEPKPQIAPKKTNIRYAEGICFTEMREHFPEAQWSNATLVIQKESGGRPDAVSKTADYGCFQIHNEPAALDPHVSAVRAFEKWTARGWRPWYAVCPKGGADPYGICFV
jgi:hypothetical protein